MKAKIIVSIVVAILLSCVVDAKEYAYSSDNTTEFSVANRWDKLIEELPEGIAEEIKDISAFETGDTISTVKEKADIRYWIGNIWDELIKSISSHLPRFLPIFAIILLLAGAKITLPQTSSALSASFLVFGKLCLAILVIRSTYLIIDLANDYLNSVCNIMNLLTPVMQAVYLAEGSLTKMSISTSAVMLVVTAIGNINSQVMTPCVNVLFTLSAVASVCDEVNLSSLTATIRRFIMRMWQIITIAFSFMLGTQSVIASSADNLAAKTVKFALGSIIPMAGGVLAEAFNTVREGLSFIKTATGIGGIITILLILLPGIVPLIIYKLSIIVCAFVADLLKLDGEKIFLEDVKGITEILIAIVLYTSMMFVFSIILFTKSQVG